MQPILVSLFAVLLILLSNTSYSHQKDDEIKVCHKIADVSISGNIVGPEDISAVTKLNDDGSLLVIGSDEACTLNKKKEKENCPSPEAKLGNYVQILKQSTNPDFDYEIHENIFLFEGDKKEDKEIDEDKEMDIEALAINQDLNLYILGSHSSKRKKVKDKNEYQKNRKVFEHEVIEDEKNRDRIYRLTLDSDGKLIGKPAFISLTKLFAEHDVLEPFSKIPSKENGVDIEGLALKTIDGKEYLFLGFRGPVFRRNFVPVMKINFDNFDEDNELLYVELGGRGIRSMTSVEDGFLIVAGPVGDGPGSYQLYHWNGKDVIPRKKPKEKDDAIKKDDEGKIEYLCDIIPPYKGKVEGIVVISENEDIYSMIISYDGVKDKIMQRFEVPTPNGNNTE